MRTKPFRSGRHAAAVLFSVGVAALGSGAASALLGLCGPFTDVTDPAFCGFVLEIYDLGITSGTTATTYSPSDPVTRIQMAAFLSREADRVLERASRHAALKQFWTPQDASVLGLTTVGQSPQLVRSDGEDLWVANFGDSTVSRVRAGDGGLLQTWTGAGSATGVVVAIGSIFVTGYAAPGALYRIDPEIPGAVTTVASNLGSRPSGTAFDGLRIWTANFASGGPLGGSVSIVTPSASLPWTVTTVTTGFAAPVGALYDGANVWVTDKVGTLLKLDGSGAILQTVTVGSFPSFPIFDGTNIWVPNETSNSVSVVRDSTGAVLATLTGNGVSSPLTAAFDGQRVLVTNFLAGSVSVWKAADLSPIGSVATGAAGPLGACSDGVNFWITLPATNQLARF
jgi:hypothetical protein